PVGFHAQDRREPLIVRTLADIARRADRNIEKSVWSEADEFLSVMRLRGQITFDDDCRWWLFEFGFDVVVAGDAADLGDIQRAFSKRDTARVLQSLGDRVDLIGLVIVVPIDKRVHLV